MSTYLIGDIHGCYDELCLLLEKVKFDPIKDSLWLTGDLVTRGLKSLQVLRYIKSLGNCIKLVLGNNDLYLIAIYAGIYNCKPKDYLTDLLKSEDIDELVNWLRKQPFLQIDKEKKIIMSHAGIAPQWDIENAFICANELRKVLSSNNYKLHLQMLYEKNSCSYKNLMGLSKLRFSINAFTKMRYCFLDGTLDMHFKDKPSNAPFYLKPWFNLINKEIIANYTIFFGHWASLEGKGTPNKIIGLDTGCCWGKYLTLFFWEKNKFFKQNSKMFVMK
ncbi:bis(5'-nucleosyl)-tetraphosphatase (symmetrical) ApaH [Candidatus Tachikawaea gelatinosa]|uniref:bis(5'-nucleosyl)-tetraphosphatase (symmetrical) n=1 Tax=Candidatus Tachikawaea gelatinosa TaxID=1410383 RepID=A0A090AK03_9ENTR|nr:bis(5'-nucleosyl)-tetraphosphatase (symmetrical) ApaH [Candidatus Tachikawaea gelatinosa]BAP58788.1 bis(5'-nucleosyl)-tetraphosphatase symmetrical [Candidatus Tachikawaea gelatinosa]